MDVNSPNIGLMLGIAILLYAIYLMKGKKLGNLTAKVTEMILDLFFGIFKGIFRAIGNLIFPGRKKKKGKKP